MAFDMIAALSTNSGDTLEAIGKEFRTAQARVKSNLEALPKTTAMQAVRNATLSLLALADGKTGVFKVRQQELDADDYGQTILEETRKLNVGLGISVQQLVDGVQKETDAATWQARQEISFGDHGHARPRRRRRWSARSCSSGSMSAATSCGGSATCSARCRCCPAATSNRRSIRPTTRTRSASMADSLQVFRESMIQSRALSAEQDKDRIAKAERASRMEARIVEFETTVRTALDSLSTAAGSMQSTAQEHVGDRRPVQRAGDRGRDRRRADLGQRADRVVGHRGIVLLDRGNRPSGRHLVGNRPQGGRGRRRDRRHHAGTCGQRRADQRGGRPDPDHRLADQSAGAERHHRGGARRRRRPRLCRGRLRGEEPRQPDREGHRRDPPADRQHADGDGRPRSPRSATSAARSPRSTR